MPYLQLPAVESANDPTPAIKRKPGKITVTPKRGQPTEVVKMDKVTVTAKRDQPATQVASSSGSTKTN